MIEGVTNALSDVPCNRSASFFGKSDKLLGAGTKPFPEWVYCQGGRTRARLLGTVRYTSACVSASTGSAWPDMFAPNFEARNTIACAMSSAETSRCSDVFASASSRTTSAATPRAAALLANTASMRDPAQEPGHNALTRMPWIPSSIDSDLVKPITPHFVAAYGVRSGNPKRPAAEDRLAVLALELFFRIGLARCAHRNCPVRLTASVRSQSRKVMSSHAAVGPAMPALLTSASRPPRARGVSW